jgi:hypothetical protein
MSDTPDAPSTPPASKPGFFRRHWGKLTLSTIIFVPAVIFTIWTGVALAYTYSEGSRTGFVQKFTKKGWVCKTWEGEIAMVNMPGAMSQIFNFTVRNDSVAGEIQKIERGGKRVVLEYKQHVGVPTSCFGDTQYFVIGVREVP